MENRQVRLARTPEGAPIEEDFEIAVVEAPKPGAGQVLCRTRYLSLDPYMRSQIAGRHLSGSIAPGDLMRGETVSEVIDSRAAGFERGQLVRGFGGWQEYSLHEGEDLALVHPDIEPPSYALSLLGMTGLTAWAGVTWQAQVKEGERVLIPAVTGGVGAAAAQFCRLAGATVIGVAGGPRKCRYAEKALGVETCIDRHGEDVPARLDALFPDGIDFYFDLVGGDLLAQASSRLALHARVVLAGLISEYNDPGRAPGPPPGDWIRARATVYGLVVYDFEARRDEFVAACLPHVKAGRLQQREDISHGIESAPAAFCRLMRGENFGKVIVAL
ncbi:MAG: NADP-dependent oxidoreductase [Gammaproteobacteria bacterium]